MENKTPLYQGLWKSFYCDNFYAEVAQSWRMRVFGYVVLLIAIITLPGLYIMQREMTLWWNNEGGRIIAQMPVITIQQGKASIDKPTPYIIHDDNNAVFAVIDTSGADAAPEFASVPLYISQGQIVVRVGTEIKSQDLAELPPMVIDKEVVRDWAEKTQAYFLPVFAPIVILMLSIMRTAQAAIFAILGMMMAGLLKTRITYLEMLRIAMIAITPALIIDTVVGLLGYPLSGVSLLLMIIAYLAFGILAVRKHRGSAEEESGVPL